MAVNVNGLDLDLESKVVFGCDMTTRSTGALGKMPEAATKWVTGDRERERGIERERERERQRECSTTRCQRVRSWVKQRRCERKRE